MAVAAAAEARHRLRILRQRPCPSELRRPARARSSSRINRRPCGIDCLARSEPPIDRRSRRWAREALAAKNSLTAADAKLVEDAFEQQTVRARHQPIPSGVGERRSQSTCRLAVDDASCASRNDRPATVILRASTRASSRLAEPKRYRNKEHLAVRGQAALPDLRPQALRPASSALHAAACARPQGERRVRGPALPRPSPRGSSGG